MVCVIPARGGSTRLPGKNIRPLFGRPVIEWVIDIAMQAGIFDDVIVSSDDEDILTIALGAGAIALDRPPELCGDVPEDDVLLDVMDRYNTDTICRVYSFAALLTPERLDAGFEAFHNVPCDCVLEAREYEHSPWRAVTASGEYIYPDAVSRPTQELKPLFHDAATYMYADRIALMKPLEDRRIKWIPVGRLGAQDVDDTEDWEMLKMKFVRGHSG